jgi:hypothetical protein
VRADARGVEVRNVGLARYLPWTEVEAVAFPDGASWARLDLPHDEYLAVMALQAVDGRQAVAGIRRLRALHATARTPPAPEPPADDPPVPQPPNPPAPVPQAPNPQPPNPPGPGLHPSALGVRPGATGPGPERTEAHPRVTAAAEDGGDLPVDD